VSKRWDAGRHSCATLNDDEVVMATAWNVASRRSGEQGAGRDRLAGSILRNDCWAVISFANAANAQKFTAFITMAVPRPGSR
jgi:hypothetical protein